MSEGAIVSAMRSSTPSADRSGRDRASAPTDASAPTGERSAHHLYVGVAWSTLARLPLLSSDLRGQVEVHLIQLCRRLDAEPVAVRAGADRVRLLLRLKPNHALATLVPRLKRGSQEALTAAGRGVQWASGYAATTVSADAVRDAIRRVGDLD